MYRQFCSDPEEPGTIVLFEIDSEGTLPLDRADFRVSARSFNGLRAFEAGLRLLGSRVRVGPGAAG